METFAILKVLFVFFSGPLCSVSFFFSFSQATFFHTIFPINFPSPLSCPSFCLLFSQFALFSLALVCCPCLSALSLWSSISLHQLCLVHNPLHCFLVHCSQPPLMQITACCCNFSGRNQRSNFDARGILRLRCFTCDSRHFNCLWRLVSLGHLNCHQRYPVKLLQFSLSDL